MHRRRPDDKPSLPRFNIRARVKSFGYAANGFVALVRYEHNAWVHLAATCLVVITGLVLRVGLEDWRWLILAIALVWIVEALNTSIERLCHLLHPGQHPQIKVIKDVAACAVLIASASAALIGAATIWPYLAAIFKPI